MKGIETDSLSFFFSFFLQEEGIFTSTISAWITQDEFWSEVFHTIHKSLRIKGAQSELWYHLYTHVLAIKIIILIISCDSNNLKHCLWAFPAGSRWNLCFLVNKFRLMPEPFAGSSHMMATLLIFNFVHSSSSWSWALAQNKVWKFSGLLEEIFFPGFTWRGTFHKGWSDRKRGNGLIGWVRAGMDGIWGGNS